MNIHLMQTVAILIGVVFFLVAIARAKARPSSGRKSGRLEYLPGEIIGREDL